MIRVDATVFRQNKTKQTKKALRKEIIEEEEVERNNSRGCM